MGVDGPRHISAALPAAKRPITHFIGGWIGAEKPPSPGYDPRTVHPVASRYIDWAVPAKE